MKYAARLSIMIVIALYVSGNAIAAEIHQAIAVTMLKAELANRTVFVRTTDGKESTFEFAPNVPVTSLAEAAINKNLHGGAGYQFILHYTVKYGDKLATGFDYVGREDWKEFRGTLQNIDPERGLVTLKPQDGAEITFFAGEHCVIVSPADVKKFQQWAAEKPDQGQVLVIHYMDVKNRKVAQLLDLTVKQ